MKLSLVFATTLAVLGLTSVDGTGSLRAASTSSSVDDVGGNVVALKDFSNGTTTMEEDFVFDRSVVFDVEDPPETVTVDIQFTICDLAVVPEEHGRYLEAIAWAFKQASDAIMQSWSMEEFTLYKEIDVPVDDDSDDDEDEGGEVLMSNPSAEEFRAVLGRGRRHNAILYAHSRSRQRARRRRSPGNSRWADRKRHDDEYYRRFKKRYPLSPFVEFHGMPGGERSELEDTICARLRMSGLKTFRHCSGCRIAYIYNPEMVLNVKTPSDAKELEVAADRVEELTE